MPATNALCVRPFKEVTLLSAATQALVGAMKAEQVTRLVAITGLGAGDSVGHGGFAFDHLIYPLLLRNVYADKNRQEAIIRASGLDWVLVRPSVLNDKPGRGSPRALENLSAFHGGTIVTTDTWLHRSPLVTW
jgi:hypothetical protein